MVMRVYLVPKIGTGAPRTDPFRPKHFRTLGASWTARNFGLEPWMLVTADVTTPQHNTLAADPEVVALPVNLDADVTLANLATVQGALEDRGIPGAWVTTATSYREIVQRIARLFAVAQCVHGTARTRLFPAGRGLASRLSDLTTGQKQVLRAAIRRAQKDDTDIVDTMTLRDALSLVMGQVDAVQAQVRKG